jgi:hypothetical protein
VADASGQAIEIWKDERTTSATMVTLVDEMRDTAGRLVSKMLNTLGR